MAAQYFGPTKKRTVVRSPLNIVNTLSKLAGGSDRRGPGDEEGRSQKRERERKGAKEKEGEGQIDTYIYIHVYLCICILLQSIYI